MGRWSDRWRHRRLDPCEWGPRKRTVEAAERVIRQPCTVLPDPADISSEFRFVERQGFPEIDQGVSQIRWSCLYSAPFRIAEHITALEGRSALWGMRWTCKHARYHGLRHLRLIDNFILSMLLDKGRGHSYDMLQISRRAAALALASGCLPVALVALGVERSLSSLAGL